MAAPAAAASSSSSSSSTSAGTPPAPAAESSIGTPECPVCTEAYACDESPDPTGCHLPRTLPCAHSVCSACLLKLLLSSFGRVKCPTCRDDRPVKSRAGMTPEALVRLVPQNGDLIQLLKRSRQLEATLHEQQWVQVVSPSGAPLRCSHSVDCVSPAEHWCDECDAATCFAHDASIHAHSMASHQRMTLGKKEAARHAKLSKALAAAGAKLKADSEAALQRQRDALARAQTADGEQLRLLQLQQQARDKTQAETDRIRARLAELEAAHTRLVALSDAEAQQQEAEFARLFGGLRVGDRIDVQDADQVWRQAEVIGVEGQRVRVHYCHTHWNSKWDVWIDQCSQRIQPFRARSANYTGPPSRQPK